MSPNRGRDLLATRVGFGAAFSSACVVLAQVANENGHELRAQGVRRLQELHTESAA